MQYDISVEEFIFDDTSKYFEASREFVKENVPQKDRRDTYNKIIDAKYALNYDLNAIANLHRLVYAGKSIWDIEPYVDYFVMVALVEAVRFERQCSSEQRLEMEKSRERAWQEVVKAFEERAKREGAKHDDS